MFQIYIYSLLLTYLLTNSESLKIFQHPLEKRICYVYGLNNIENVNSKQIDELKKLFSIHPLMIFKNVQDVNPSNFINFLTNFDNDCDYNAILNPEENKQQILQPFDSFPNCRHVAPRGNFALNNLYDLKNITVKPGDSFINNYVWHTDLLGHDSKLPNVVTGFHIIEQPLIGGDTDFISGETIYENLEINEQLNAQNILIEVNRLKFLFNKIETDYSGSSRLEKYKNLDAGNTILPLVFAPDNEEEKPRILLLPSFFERVVGWNVDESREWIKNFMYTKVLPHRVSIQWKKGDLCVFNNRRFMHSSTPARNYLSFNDSSTRLLLQTFIPTKKSLYGIVPKNQDIYNTTIFNKDSMLYSSYEFHKYYTKRMLDDERYLIMPDFIK